METMGDEPIVDIDPPKYGLKLQLDNVYPLQSKQIIIPRPKQIIEMMPLTIRYLKYHFGKWVHNKKPIMNYINMISAQRMYGCPIGGIGGGTIGRGYKGEFCRFQLTPGIYEYITVPECQFIVNIRNENNETIFQSVLSTYLKPKKAPASWEWNLDGSKCKYTALYPRAWTTYDLSEYGIKLVCRQISPVIPHNYKDSSLPCAVFVFTATNICNKHREVNITFTWTEVLNNSSKKTTAAKLDLERYSEEYTCGVTLEQKIKETPCTFTIAKKKQDGETIHEGYCLWNATKTPSYVWDCLKENGRLAPDLSLTPAPPKVNDKSEKSKQDNGKPRKLYKSDSIGLSSGISLEPGKSGMTEFCLAWDMPIIKYATENKVHKRYYTKYFGSDGIAGASIAAYALRNYTHWERQLAEWQNPILNNSNIPDWLKSALMNELYYIADGGTIWFDVADEYPESDPRHDFGLFGYLEGHEYRMYNTYDVHFYASFALAQLWPNLQVVLQFMFRDTIELETKECRQSLYDGKVVKYKIKDSIPHDLGDPEGVPFSKINAYNIHDVSEWRDLNLKFILQVMRDYQLLRGLGAPFSSERYRHMAFIDDVRAGTEDDLYARATGQAAPASPPPRAAPAPAPAWDARRYLAALYPACAALYRRAALWDRDDDGLIENAGFPDQTYDAWLMEGPSAYCGGLWVAALAALRAMARLAAPRDEPELAAALQRARRAHHAALWAGDHYRFDARPRNDRVLMADQLVGHLYLRASGITEPIFPESNVKKALRSIFENNVLKFNGGKMGAVNGYVAGEGGHIDTSALQSEEVWTGVTYGLAATMLYEGMNEEAFVTAGGLHKSLTDRGLSFETPEALYENGNHRSIGYMRPLAVWAMYQAILSRPPSTTTTTTANGLPNHAKENTAL